MEYLDNVIKEAASELGLPYDKVREAYYSQWHFIKDTILDLDLKRIPDLEGFGKVRTNFSIPSLGKMFVTEDKFMRRKRFEKKLDEMIKKKKDVQSKENQADVQPDSDDSEHVQGGEDQLGSD